MSRTINEISRDIATQDNLATDSPLWIVFNKKRQLGMDTQYADDQNIIWVDNCNDYTIAGARKHKQLEKNFQKDGKEPDCWTRTAFTWKDEFVTACFTRKGAEAYIALNGHNLTNPFIYAASLYRNEEMKLVRSVLLQSADGDGSIHSGETISVLTEQSPPKEEETFLETGKQ